MPQGFKLTPGGRRALLFISGSLLLGVVSFFIIFYGMYPKVGDPARVQAPSDPQTVARGQYLANILGCVGCHSPLDTSRPGEFPIADRLMAGRTFDAHPAFPGTLAAPNITGDPEDGIGRWTDGEVLRAMREGISHDDAPIFPAMPYRAFQVVPDVDGLAIIAWLRTVPHSSGSPRSDIAMNARIRARMVPQPLVEAPPPWPEEPVERGNLLMRVMGCWRCHTYAEPGKPAGGLRYLGGQRFDGRWGTVYAGNLTAHKKDGLGGWTDPEIAAVLKSGRLPEGRLAHAMPWSATSALNDGDLAAIIAALRALPGARHRVSKPELSDSDG
jgi:hypothetical protein